MKKSVTLLGISLLATAIIDLSFPLRSTTFSFVLAAVVFFLTSYLFYERIMEKVILNSTLVLFFLFALMSFGYIVNTKASVLWAIITACSITGYLSGLTAKRVQKKKDTLLSEQATDK